MIRRGWVKQRQGGEGGGQRGMVSVTRPLAGGGEDPSSTGGILLQRRARH